MSVLPTISVIVPSYNVERYISAALESLINQTVVPDEIIIIDDGSTDGTKAIIERSKASFDFIFISTSNQGQGAARNLGIEVASCDYLYFFDADDLLDKFTIEKIKCEILSNEHPDIILFSGESFDDSEYQGGRWVDYKRGFSGFYNNRLSFLKDAYEKKSLFCSPCMYVSRRNIWMNRLQFGDGYFEDEGGFYPLIFSCERFLVLDEVLFYRRNRDGSTMTMKFNEKHMQGALSCLSKSLDFKKVNIINSEEAWFFKKRIERQVINYIKTSKSVGANFEFRILVKAIIEVKSFVFIVKVVAHSLGLSKFQFVKKFNDIINRWEWLS